MTLKFLPLPSAEELRKLFDYKPDGALYWKHCNNSQVGLDKPAGWHRRNGYCEIKIRNKSYKRNRLIWCYFNGDPGEYEVDHINRIKNDDRIENLRLATRKQNQCNRAVLQTNKAGFKGIHKDHSGKWRAQITGPNGKTMHLGRYDTPCEASVAYTVAANFIQGDFAYSRLATPPPEPPTAIGPEWQPCVKLPITVHVREQRPGETHSSTREGITPLRSDDLIMRGVQGEEYPIGRELFNQTYRMEATPPPEPPNFDEVLTVYTQTFQETFMQGRNNLEDCKVAGLRAVLERWGK